MSTTVRDIPPIGSRPSTRSQARWTVRDVERTATGIALTGTVALSFVSTVACAVAILRPTTSPAWLLAIAVAAVFEVTMHIGKLTLRDDVRSLHGWLFAALDAVTNTAGVYWAAPGLATLPVINHVAAVVGGGEETGMMLGAILIGLILSAAPPFLLDRWQTLIETTQA